mgnify:CR=1 FL=1
MRVLESVSAFFTRGTAGRRGVWRVESGAAMLGSIEKRRRKKVNEEVKDKRTNQDLGRKRNTKIKRKRERDRNHNPPKAQVIVISIDLID